MNVNPSAEKARSSELGIIPGPSGSVADAHSDSKILNSRDSTFENVQINIRSSDARVIAHNDDPKLGIPDRRMISFHISSGVSVKDCPFWIGIAGRGEIHAPSLLNHIAMEDLFSEAAIRGICDKESVMLTDTLTQPARYVFLMPRPGNDFRETSAWITSLVATVRAWSPDSVGFYLAPEIIVAHDSHDILAQVFRELIATMPGTTAFHLLVGRHSFNGVLNTALRLKSELEGDDLNVFVYH